MKSTDYSIMHIYTTCDHLAIRELPSLNAEIKMVVLPNTDVLCINVFVDTSGNTWIKNPLGWMLAIEHGEVKIR